MTVAELAHSYHAWLFRHDLDRSIALGANPASSPALERRARRLVSPGFRARMAAGLRRVVAVAEEPSRHRVSAQVPVQRAAIVEERALVLTLARMLTDEPTVTARGVARVEELLMDGRSPLYCRSPPGALGAALRHAKTTLLLG